MLYNNMLQLSSMNLVHAVIILFNEWVKHVTMLKYKIKTCLDQQYQELSSQSQNSQLKLWNMNVLFD